MSLEIKRVWRDAHTAHVKAVKKLGDEIGYGNMMSIASALWQMELKKNYGLEEGAFIPTKASLMKDEEGQKALEEQKRRINQLKEVLGL